MREIEADLQAVLKDCGHSCESFQSNSEGALIDKIHAMTGKCELCIANPGGYTHTSVALRDALIALNAPIIEVHCSNIYAREKFRHTSLLADIATGRICGFGPVSYNLAARAACAILAENQGGAVEAK